MVLSAGHAPSSETYLAGIRGCIKSGNQLGGLHIYEAMISARVSPDAETLETVLEGLPEVSTIHEQVKPPEVVMH